MLRPGDHLLVLLDMARIDQRNRAQDLALLRWIGGFEQVHQFLVLGVEEHLHVVAAGLGLVRGTQLFDAGGYGLAGVRRILAHLIEAIAVVVVQQFAQRAEHGL